MNQLRPALWLESNEVTDDISKLLTAFTILNAFPPIQNTLIGIVVSFESNDFVLAVLFAAESSVVRVVFGLTLGDGLAVGPDHDDVSHDRGQQVPEDDPRVTRTHQARGHHELLAELDADDCQLIHGVQEPKGE